MILASRFLAILGFIALGTGAFFFTVLQFFLCFDSCPSNVPLTELQLAVETLGPGILLAGGAWGLAFGAAGAADDGAWRRRLRYALLAAVVALIVMVGTAMAEPVARALSVVALVVWPAAGIVLVVWPLITVVASFRIGAGSMAPATGAAPPLWWLVRLLTLVSLLMIGIGGLVFAFTPPNLANYATSYALRDLGAGFGATLLAWVLCLVLLARAGAWWRFWLVLAALPVAAVGAAALLYALTGTVLPPDTETAFGDWLTVWLGAALVLLLWPAAILVFAESRARPRTLRPAT